MSDMIVDDQQSPHHSFGGSTWAFLTNRRVTWRQAGEGSVTLGVLAGASALVVAAAVFVRRMRR